MNQEIPENWIKVKFKELAKQKSVRVDDPGESGYEKYVGLEHLDSGELVVKRYGSTSDVTSTMKLFEKDDILFARRNTYLRRVSVAPFDGVCSGDIIVLEPKLKHIVKGFLPIFMQFEPFENKIIALSAGAFSKRIKWKQLAEEEIVIPSIEEQKKIVETIWSIQDNIEQTDKLIKISTDFKKGLFRELFSKGIKDKKLRRTDTTVIPEGWILKKIGEFCEVKTGGTPSTKNKDYWDGNIKWMSSGEIHNKFVYDTEKKITQEGLDNSNAKFLPQNSVMMALNGQGKTRGTVAITKVPLTCNQSLACMIPDKNVCNCSYLFYNLQSRYLEIRNYTGDNRRSGLSLSIVKSFEIPLPPIDEQEKIAEIFNLLDESISNYLQNINSLHSLKNKITNDFLSGNLKIPQEALQNVQ